jgi:hypothetical protein
MKITTVLILLLGLVGCATYPPTLTNQYKTLGFYVNEYDSGGEKLYEISDDRGNVLYRANLLGFVQWKQQRLLHLIGSESTGYAERERYKIEYQDISQKLTAFNMIVANQNIANQQNFQNSVNNLNQQSNQQSQAIYSSFNSFGKTNK